MSIPFDQVSFLFLCLEHHKNGKIDFTAVAKEYERIHQSPLTRGAAFNRYTRLKEKVMNMTLAAGVNNVFESPNKKRVKKEESDTRTLKESPLKRVKREESEMESRVKSNKKMNVKLKEEEESD